MSCSGKDVNKLVINIAIKTYCSERAAERENVQKVLRN